MHTGHGHGGLIDIPIRERSLLWTGHHTRYSFDTSTFDRLTSRDEQMFPICEFLAVTLCENESAVSFFAEDYTQGQTYWTGGTFGIFLGFVVRVDF